MRGVRTCALAALVLCAAGLAFAADDANVFRVNAQYVIPSGDLEDFSLTVEADDAFGLGASYERRTSDLIGLQFGLGWSDHDVNFSVDGFVEDEKLAETTMYPLYTTVLFHPLARDSKVDWYIGPGIAYIIWDDLSIESSYGGGSEPVENEATWTARTGVDIKFGDTWALNLDVQYFQSSAASSGTDVKVNPYVAGVGFAYRF